MEESLLLRIATATSLIGLVVLFLLSQLLEPVEIELGDLMQQDEGSDITLEGVIQQVQSSDKIAYIDLAYPESVKATVFLSGGLELEKGDYVKITGEVTEFRGQNQLVASEIEVLG
ncbi:hypothetical protein KY320_00735 [Candidatus Woesearchaeota archaeon]|nr:hypothetical protein [Candidatus Woesearchaeota archaeon]